MSRNPPGIHHPPGTRQSRRGDHAPHTTLAEPHAEQDDLQEPYASNNSYSPLHFPAEEARAAGLRAAAQTSNLGPAAHSRPILSHNLHPSPRTGLRNDDDNITAADTSCAAQPRARGNAATARSARAMQRDAVRSSAEQRNVAADDYEHDYDNEQGGEGALSRAARLTTAGVPAALRSGSDAGGEESDSDGSGGPQQWGGGAANWFNWPSSAKIFCCTSSK